MSVQLNRKVVTKHLAPPVNRVGSGVQTQWHLYIGIGLVVIGLYVGNLIAVQREVAPIVLKNDISLFALFLLWPRRYKV